MSRFIGRGEIYVAERVNDLPGKFHFVGCADDFDIALGVELEQKYSKCTSADALEFQRVRRQNADVTMNLTQWIKKNLLIAFRGTEVPDATSEAVTNEACGSGFLAGDIYFLGAATGKLKANVSSVTLSDTGGALVENTDYTLDAYSGKVTFLDATSGAVEADYTYDMPAFISLFTAGQKDYWVRFVGVNAANEDEKVMFDAYKVQFNPASSLGLLTDESAPLELSGGVLQDQSKAANDDWDQFGLMTVLS